MVVTSIQMRELKSQERKAREMAVVGARLWFSLPIVRGQHCISCYLILNAV